MVDLHQHLLFGLDDGARNYVEMEQMIINCSLQDIDTVVATPHIWPGAEMFPIDVFQENTRIANEIGKKHGVKILPGAEVLYSENCIPALKKKAIPTLANGPCILVEFYPDSRFESIQSAVRGILDAGYHPVIAHMERYQCLYRNRDRVDSLHNIGAVMQINAEMIILHRFFNQWQGYYFSLIRDGLIDCVASDAHNTDSRPLKLQKAREKLERVFGATQALQLTDGIPRHLLNMD